MQPGGSNCLGRIHQTCNVASSSVVNGRCHVASSARMTAASFASIPATNPSGDRRYSTYRCRELPPRKQRRSSRPSQRRRGRSSHGRLCSAQSLYWPVGRIPLHSTSLPRRMDRLAWIGYQESAGFGPAITVPVFPFPPRLRTSRIRHHPVGGDRRRSEGHRHCALPRSRCGHTPPTPPHGRCWCGSGDFPLADRLPRMRQHPQLLGRSRSRSLAPRYGLRTRDNRRYRDADRQLRIAR
jgi:hypothetical protein